MMNTTTTAEQGTGNGQVAQLGLDFTAAPKTVEEITQGRTIWNSDGTDGPCLICAPQAKTAKPILKLVEEIKNEDQDFEFYPTTDAIIAALKRDMKAVDCKGRGSVLDIGAGNGKVLRSLKEPFLD